MSNAINPKAILDKIATFSSSRIDLKAGSGMFNAPRTYGPTHTPAIKNAVTSGNLNFNNLKTRVMIKPANKANAVARRLLMI